MKKDVIIAIVLFLVGLFFAVPQAEAGRLNFMLINMTNDDIVDITICPTYSPKNTSKNLLNTRVEPNTRTYIGPNLHGHQRYWNINVTWANGRRQTFTHNRLTRYNTYLMYATPQGIGVRQRYERAFARYTGIPASIGAEGPSCVGFGIAEKENVAGKSALAFMSFLHKGIAMCNLSSVAFSFCDRRVSFFAHVAALRVVAGMQSGDKAVSPFPFAQLAGLKESFSLPLNTRGRTCRSGEVLSHRGDKDSVILYSSSAPLNACSEVCADHSVRYRSPPGCGFSVSCSEFVVERNVLSLGCT